MPELSIITPTYNEAPNLETLLSRLKVVLEGIDWELIVVDDDSPDGTAELARSLSQSNPRMRCLHRIGRRGLSSACIEGILASSADFVAVMDADLQHDEKVLPAMLQIIRDQDADMVVGSRYIQGGRVSNWSSERLSLSRAAIILAHRMTGVRLSDPISGFFLASRDILLPILRRTSGIGFKILLDIILSADRPLVVREIPYDFNIRTAGHSKMDLRVAWQFLLLLLDKTLGKFIPVRFISFILVGSIGVMVHLAILALLHKLLGIAFSIAQASAALCTMSMKFLLNNVLTYSDRRLRGKAMIRGWFSFVLTCSLGGLANVGVAAFIFSQNVSWLSSALAGILVGAVWNFAVTSTYTWKIKN